MARSLVLTIRRLLSRPTFTITAVATLAIGVGATTAIFSTVDATLLSPLPYPSSGDLYQVRTIFVDGRWTSGRMTGAYVAGINESAPSVIHAVASLDQETVLTTDEGDHRAILLQSVTEGFFELFALPMAAGRSFTPEEHAGQTPNSTAVGVISYRLWMDAFGGDPNILDRSLDFAAGRVTVVGVAAPEFDVPEGTDLWIATSVSPASVSHSFESYLRVRPGTSADRLRSELGIVMAGLWEAYPQAAPGRAFVATRLVDVIVGNLGPILLVVLDGATLLLLLGAVNVAMLILGRGAGQAKEVAIRATIGAGRAAIFKQFLLESFVLAAGGTLLGLALAWVGVRALLAFGASRLPRLDQVPFDARVVLFAAGVLAVSTLLVGLLPALRLSTPDIRGLLNENSRSTTGSRSTHRLLSGLVVVEVALAITLVAGAGWLVRSYENLTDSDPGFVSEGRLVFRADLYGTYYAPIPKVIEGPDGNFMLDPEQPPGSNPQEWLETLTGRLLASPQIEAVGSASSYPLQTDWDGSDYIGVPGEPYDPGHQSAGRYRAVSRGFFHAMGIRLMAGRDFIEGEAPNATIVNEAFVRRYFPDRDPIGESFAHGFPVVNFDSELRVVGVVADVKYASLMEPPDPTYYRPAYPPEATVVVRTSLEDPTPLISTIRTEAATIEPAIPVDVELADAIVEDQVVRHRLGLILMSLFAVVSLALAALGIYGVIAHITAQRTPELATRIALGATPSRVRGLVMRQGRALAVVGTALGLAAAYIGGRAAASRLYEVRASDPAVLVVAAAIVLGITLLAFLVPALRAGRIEPRRGLLGE